MPRRGQPKTISLDEEAFHYLSHAKANFEKITRLKVSWNAFLVAISSGALAAQAISGLKLSCPNCGHEMRMTITQFKVTEDKEANRS